MKLILVMVMLATALSSSGCASRRAAAREAQAAKLAKSAPAAAATKSAAPATTPVAATPVAEPVVNTYAVSALPVSAKSTPPAALTPPARPATTGSSSRPVAPVAVVAGNPGTPMPLVQRAEAGSKASDSISGLALENIEQVPFQIGVSSVNVERLAQAAGCVGGKGAGLVTEKGPLEVYRMQCDNGKVFLAKCELRQCSPLRWQ